MGATPADAAVRYGQRGLAEFIRTFRDPVKSVGGVLGVGRRLEFIESGQLKSVAGIVEEKKREARGVAAALARGGKRKLRKAGGAAARAATKYAVGMVKGAAPAAAVAVEFPTLVRVASVVVSALRFASYDTSSPRPRRRRDPPLSR